MIAPVVTSLIEVAVWTGIFRGLQATTLGGFGLDNYLAYAIWGSFVARISVTWNYESRMIEEIESGSINVLLSRPTSFYEYYLFQFFGYKVVTTFISLLVPLTAALWFDLPIFLDRLPLALLLIFYYLILVHTLSFCIATIAFHLNRVHSFTVAKNLSLWLLSGELIPLDLLPDFWRGILLNLPFANAVYIPVGYITGRGDIALLQQGFLTTTIGIIFFGLLARLSWQSGIRVYTGTGA